MVKKLSNARELKRCYVYGDLFNKVTEWAYKLWKKEKVYAVNGKPLYLNFPASLESYIKRGGK